VGGTPNAVIFAREREEHRRLACGWRRAAWFQKVHREECQSPHGRDGHAPFFRAAILTALGGTPTLLEITGGRICVVFFHCKSSVYWKNYNDVCAFC
jgi:hypothetical protein